MASFADGLANKRCDEAEAFAVDPANALYYADVAHLSEKVAFGTS